MPNLARPALALLAAAAVAAPASADVRSGVEAYQRGDYAAAIREWRPLADRGDPDAQFNLAQAYKLGRGVPANLDTAMGYYRKAALQNHGEAEALLGLLLFQNGKRADAMPWLAKAAARGDAAAQYVYGTALFNGDMVATDWPRAYGLMTRAASQGLPPARQALLEMDKHIPLAQRQQGAALARGAPVAASRAIPVRPAPTRVASRTDARPVSSPVRPPLAPVAAARPVASAPRAAALLPSPRVAGWKVQLGAFTESASANALFASLKGRVPALGGAQPILVPAGAVTRLQAGPFANRATAAAACAAVKARTGNACFPVAP